MAANGAFDAFGSPAFTGASSEDRSWLTAAVEMSRLSPPTSTNYAVGAIIVDRRGSVLATGYTGEIGPRDHAEEAALAKLSVRPGIDLSQATIYSSLEPCTARKSRPGTCTDLILAAGIGRVVLALREPLLFADCHGVESLREGGVEVIEITDLAYLVREINAHVLDLRPARTQI
ncbi:deaminase [Actinoplanes sp. NPDC051346]|uniref:deaminase n=1 Tax=Actinoplanes sp. NPDC051346 TaxID=3155048 RepID=UPI003427E132